jgi:signal transduction histidine kinase
MGLGFSRHVPDAVRDSVVRAMRAQGIPEFRLWPDTARPETHAIVYIEPMTARNRAALGYDMFAERTRREAMARARDSGEPAMSGIVTLVQELEHAPQPGFLVYLPVYRGGEAPATVEARRAALLGFVYTPFRVREFFEGLTGAGGGYQTEMRAYSGTRAHPDSLRYDSGVREGRSHRDLADTMRLELAGQPWTVVYTPSTEFVLTAEARWLTLLTVAGVIVSALLFALSWGQARTRMIAERHALEAERFSTELREQARVADEANRAKSQFLANMSHELRTPLNAIGGYAELLALGVRGPVSDAQRADLERMLRAQRHLLGLINDVLNFARLEAGKVEYDLRPVPVHELLADAAALIAPQAAGKGLAFHRDTADPALRVVADADKAQQVLLNLLSNAVKFTREGGAVSLACEATDTVVALRVRDTGIGIPADRLQGIFDPFTQVHGSLTRTAQGTGLGLAISRELAEGMGGAITVTSTPDEGSTFTFTLPRG